MRLPGLFPWLAAAALLAACNARESAPVQAERQRERPAPPGIYFLHDRGFGVERCRLITEAVRGASRRPGRPEGLSNAARELADQARRAGGNVVLLPHFREEYAQGALTGRIYACNQENRRRVFRRAAAADSLTVIEP